MNNYKKSKGAALLMFFIVLLLGATSLFLNKANNSVSLNKSAKTTLALKTAKQALIDYATTYYYRNDFKRFGFLPCPDQDGGNLPGNFDGNCESQNVTAIGKFPWKSLGTGVLHDNSGECLWYAVSGLYKNATYPTVTSYNSGAVVATNRTEMLNEDSNGAFQYKKSDATMINGSLPEDRVVALIIAPKKPLSGQVRDAKSATDLCSPDYSTADFLENYNGVNNRTVSSTAFAIDDFIQGDFTSKDNLNDQIITISRGEIFSSILKSNEFTGLRDRTTEALAWCISDYGQLGANNGLPWAAPLVLADYQVDINYADSVNLKFGRYPYLVNNSLTASFKNIIDDAIPTSEDMNNFSDIFDSCSARLIGGINVEMNNEGSAERLFWKHWKDHFYYAVANKYDAGSGVTAGGACPPPQCIKVNSNANRRAAIVFFSGSRLSGLNQIRNANIPSGDVDSKKTISNYLEGNNANYIGDTNGTGLYQYELESATFNDVMYCLDSSLTVLECPL